MADEQVVQGGATSADGASSSSVSSGSLESRINAAVPAEQGRVSAGPALSGPTTVGAADGAPVQGQQPTPAEWQGITDFARAQGMELPWKDDTQALTNLLQAYRQLQQRNFHAEVGQRVQPYASQFQEFLAQRQQQQALQQAQQPKPWAAPPFKREWLAQVETDEATGALRAKPGYDPAIADKVQAYADWRDKFLQAPDEVLKPWVASEAQQIVQAQMAVYQEQQQADALIQRESTWMFQGGQRGGPLTAAGQMYQRVTNALFQGGLHDVRQLHAAGVSAVQNAFFRQQAQAQAASQTNAARTPAQQAEAPLSVAGTIGRRGTSGARQPTKQDTQPNMSLRQRLMMKTEGVPE
jgi:hypothetical protein